MSDLTEKIYASQDWVEEKITSAIADKSNIDHTHTASEVGAYSKDEIDSLELITVEDIDTICGASIQLASEVKF